MNDHIYSKYANTFHGHIITEDINIVSNVYVRNFVCDGTEIRIPFCFTANSILKQFNLDLDFCIKFDYNKPLEFFNEWKLIFF